jgi:predicted component of type VI protein secretion system
MPPPASRFSQHEKHNLQRESSEGRQDGLTQLTEYCQTFSQQEQVVNQGLGETLEGLWRLFRTMLFSALKNSATVRAQSQGGRKCILLDSANQD